MTAVNPWPFQFERDTFAFPNELIWEYRLDPTTGQAITFRREPPPTYAHHCFVLIRSARQFLYHARFDPTQPVADAATYDRLIRAVVSRNPRLVSAPERRMVAWARRVSAQKSGLAVSLVSSASSLRQAGRSKKLLQTAQPLDQLRDIG